MPRWEFQTTPSGGRRFVRVEHGQLKKAVPRVIAEAVTVPDESAVVIEPPDPPVAAVVDIEPVATPVVSDAEIKVPKARTVRRRSTKKSSG